MQHQQRKQTVCLSGLQMFLVGDMSLISRSTGQSGRRLGRCDTVFP